MKKANTSLAATADKLPRSLRSLSLAPPHREFRLLPAPRSGKTSKIAPNARSTKTASCQPPAFPSPPPFAPPEALDVPQQCALCPHS